MIYQYCFSHCYQIILTNPMNIYILRMDHLMTGKDNTRIATLWLEFPHSLVKLEMMIS